ncbi:phospholipid scramblase 1-like isoform X2 [Ruditapes philippinarum]|uniref:phospholipid scramblase 1-like isoform X2 n=1 Tax=Ruditapes philippinarum TaxID=129788 RepID=UPI00295A991D|nr:phospholipid scramblase 1-like isoform X2 [Ruditapes philippinarum]
MEKSLYPPEPPPSYDSLPGIVQQQPSAPPPPVMPMQGMSRMPGLSEMPGMSGMPPAQILWMTRPLGRVTCPRGLEYLNQLNKLFIHQEIDNSPGGMYDESAYWYKIMNANGQQVFTAIEDPSNTSGTCVCLPGQRGYNVRIKDNINNEVMRVTRDPICCSCCPCLGCEHVVKIEAPVGQVIGYFKSQKGCGSITFTISDAGDQVVFIIKFPACATSSYQQAQEYQVLARDGITQLARFTKHWGKIEDSIRLKKFSLTFPMDLDERMKAVLLGTIFAIIYFCIDEKCKDITF